jgi:hypothetical protein
VEMFSLPIDRPPRSPLFPAQSGLQWPGFYATVATSESRRSLPDLCRSFMIRRASTNFKVKVLQRQLHKPEILDQINRCFEMNDLDALCCNLCGLCGQMLSGFWRLFGLDCISSRRRPYRAYPVTEFEEVAILRPEQDHIDRQRYNSRRRRNRSNLPPLIPRPSTAHPTPTPTPTLTPTRDPGEMVRTVVLVPPELRGLGEAPMYMASLVGSHHNPMFPHAGRRAVLAW